jgi:hypothetical protein
VSAAENPIFLPPIFLPSACLMNRRAMKMGISLLVAAEIRRPN